MTSTHSSIRLVVQATIVMLAVTAAASASIQNAEDLPPPAFQERTYEGKPILFWLKALRDRNEELIPRAFEAVRSLDEEAWIAVPVLTRLISAPFAPINPGTDSHELIASKLYDIAVRTEAVETLAWIGESGAPSTTTLVQWALTERVGSLIGENPDDRGLFIELVAMDAEQRMRVAGAVAAFGPSAFPAVARLLTSADAAQRKLAVAILNENALLMAAELLQSEACEDRELGILVLKDMDMVVAQRYIDELARQIRRNCTLLSKAHKHGPLTPVSSTK